MTTAFLTSVDIANRALQHVGAKRITSLSDDSKNAAAVSFVYPKLRRAELRRNVWRFAIRKAALRPIGPDSKRFAFTTPPTDYAGPLIAQLWDATTVYWSGELVYNVSGMTTTVYQSRISGNEAAVTDTASWRVVAGTLTAIEFDYPIGAGPITQEATRNVFELPANYLRRAPQDPKEGSHSIQGAPTNLNYDDWNFEGNYLISSFSTPIVLRFVADITDVSSMDDLFCEGLGCRIGLEVCEELTQSADKISTIGAFYKEFMGDARQVNSIEIGSDEPPLDDYIATRV
jgi:hypothetical protein